MNQETGWSYHQSSNQSFYIFEEIEIDGNPPVGDGWAPTLTEDSYCLNNPNTCDVIGAFINNECVGWVYADELGGTTLPLMGYDETNETLQNLTENYCVDGDIPEIKIYDASYGTILSMVPGQELPEWENNYAHIIFNISFANNGIVNPESSWFYYQSSEQAFYLFENILIDGIQADPNDILGAFKDDICVGWTYVSDQDFTAVPAMGAELDNFDDYMYEGENPTFKLYDSSEDIIFDLLPSDTIPGWENNSYFIIYGNSTTVLYGCLDPDADNYNPDVDLQCEDCCNYIQTIDLITGWNMFSFNLIPMDDSLYEIITPLHDLLLLVLDETGSAIFPDETGSIWTDNIAQWYATEGYLIKISESSLFEVISHNKIPLPINIPLTAGWNIISYPVQDSQLITDVLSSIIDNGNLYSVFDEAGNVFIPNVVNSINLLQPGEAYYVKVNEDDSLSIDDLEFNSHNFSEGTNLRTEHFETIWDGNPFSPMTIFINNATWDEVALNEGDEIGIFDGDLCVGAALVPEGGFNAFDNFQVVTSKDDGSGNGFTEGNDITFRVWRQSIDVDIDVTIDVFTDELGSPMEPKFEALRAPFSQINAYVPSEAQNFNLLVTNEGIHLTWIPPIQGNYQMYNYPEIGSSNAVVYNLTRDDQVISESLDATTFIDINLDYNTEYNYEVESTSPIGVSNIVENNAITLPGVPMLSELSENLNSILLDWSNPDITGEDDQIFYTIERQWNVGDSIYSNIIIDSLYNQEYQDNNLLNSSSFSYRLRATNFTGSSLWSDYFSGSTTLSLLDPIIGVNGNAYQTLIPTDNVIELSWDALDGVAYYRVYEQNILLADSIYDDTYIDSERNLETSSWYRYIVTGLLDEGETSPSLLIAVQTLPEIDPDAPQNITIESGQNLINLTWDIVPGYGDPIGGGATSYNIYRFNIDDISIGENIYSNYGLNSTEYTDSNLDDNVTNCYGVSAVNSENSEGPISELVCETTLTQLAASTPSNLHIDYVSSSQINLDWEPSIGSPPIYYQVYRDNEFIVNTSSTSYNDQNLASNNIYEYFVVAWNELGPSDPSGSISSSTSSQSNLLASEIPEDLSVVISDNARASNYIDGYAEIAWDDKYYGTHPFELSYEGNPYSPHTIVITNPDSFEVGDIIAVFDRDEQLCVGYEVVGSDNWPQMSASKDDGSGNGFVEGHSAYFKVWKSSTNHVHSINESPNISFSGLALDYVDLTVLDERYNVFRNGDIIVSNLESEFYHDTNLESGMTYNYYITSENILGEWTQSNPSDVSSVNTLDGEEYPHNAPILTAISNQQIIEDSSIGIFLDALDDDGDELIYFAEPFNPNSPVVCEVENNVLSLTPAPNFYDEDGFDIVVTVFDDTQFYESNTLSSQQQFTLSVLSENDFPFVLNPLEDIQVLQGDYEDYLVFDISTVFADADIIVMNELPLTYSVSNSDSTIINSSIDNDSLYIQYLSSGVVDIYITASDQYNVNVSDTLSMQIDEVLSADDYVWPETFSISHIYPNPFNPITNFEIEIPDYSRTSINVYNLKGQLIDIIFSGYLPKGTHLMKWNANSFPSGVYFISMIVESNIYSQKAILLK